MKIVDHFTGKLAVLADNMSNDDDGFIGIPSCDYSVFPANEYLLKVIRKIVKTSTKFREYLRDESDQTGITSIEFSFCGQVDFFGEISYKGMSEFYNSILKYKEENHCLCPVSTEKDGIDEFMSGISFKRFKQTEDGDHSVIVYNTELNTICFKYNPDMRTDFRTHPIKIDELINYLEKNLENKGQ